MPQSRKIYYSFYEPGDEDKIVALYEKTFGKSRSLRFWHHQFMKNPHGEPVIALAWNETGDVVGAYSLLPRRFLVDCEYKTGFQEVDLMVHPDYMGKGLFKKLSDMAYGELRKLNFEFTFGFPNTVSLPIGRKKLGWEIVAPIPFYRRYFDPAFYLTKKYGMPKTLAASASRIYSGIEGLVFRSRRRHNRYLIEGFNDFTERFDEIWENRPQMGKITGVRDAHYLAWRFSNLEDERYRFWKAETDDKLCGYIVGWSCDETSTAGIADWFCRSGCEDCLLPLFDTAINYYREQGKYKSLQCWHMNPLVNDASLSKLGFMKKKTEIYLVIRPFNNKSLNETLRQADEWFLFQGDSDTI